LSELAHRDGSSCHTDRVRLPPCRHPPVPTYRESLHSQQMSEHAATAFNAVSHWNHSDAAGADLRMSADRLVSGGSVPVPSTPADNATDWSLALGYDGLASKRGAAEDKRERLLAFIGIFVRPNLPSCACSLQRHRQCLGAQHGRPGAPAKQHCVHSRSTIVCICCGPHPENGPANEEYRAFRRLGTACSVLSERLYVRVECLL
jgi:hypothetical protein